MSAWVIPTNEELMIARHTGMLLGTHRSPRLAGRKRRRTDGWDRTQTKNEEGDSPWQGFHPGLWQKEINVRDFIQQNYEPYDGDESFLAPATEAHAEDLGHAQELFVEERKKGVLDVSPIPSSITAHAPGYIDRDNEIIVGLQTDAPLKRAIMPNGGFRMVVNALKTYGYEPDPHVVEAFTKYRKTHNDAVFDAYTADVRRCRSSHVLTGLPDAYGRGRIIGDYRRVALYGVAGSSNTSRRRSATSIRRCRPTTSSAIARSSPSRSARSRNCSRWRRATASTSRVRRATRRKPCSGSTSGTWPR